MHKIHYDSPSNDKNADKVSIEGALKKVGMKRIFLPPGSPQLNPV
jgi:transposase